MTLQIEQLPPAVPRRGQKMSFEEYLNATFDHHHYEWVNGEAVEMPAVNATHSEAVIFLIRLIADYAEAKDLGKLLAEPFTMRASDTGNARLPDILFIVKENLPRLRENHLKGPADLAVEVISVGSRHKDRVEKFAEYQAGGVREYWLIDPLRKQAEFYTLVNGQYQLAALDEQTGRFQSQVLPGFFLDVQWLWDRPAKRELLKLMGVE